MGKVFTASNVKGKAHKVDFESQKAFGMVSPLVLECWLGKADGVSGKCVLAKQKRRVGGLP